MDAVDLQPVLAQRTILTLIEGQLQGSTAQALALAVSRVVGSGDLTDGTRLPPVRDVAHQLMLSPTTVAKAWRQLREAGLLSTDGRRGSRVVGPGQVSPERYGLVVDPASRAALDLSTGVPDAALLPPLTGALSRLPAAAVPRSYRDDPVLSGLRAQLLAVWPYRPEQLTITDGAMDAVAMLSRLILRYGDVVVLEDPTFPPLLDLFDSLGVRVVGVGVDEEGMDPNAFQAALSGEHRVGLVVLQPRAHNPLGVSMSPQRARALATAARLAQVPVIEDDSSAGVSCAEPVSLGRWIPEQTMHVRGFSKSHGPDLRIAAVSGSTSVLARLAVRRQLGQGWTSRLLQQVLLDLLSDPTSVAAVGRAREAYRERRERLRLALANHGIDCPGRDGLNLWVPVRDESAARVALAAAGIAVAPGAPFRITSGLPAVRVTTASVAAGHDSLARELARAANTGPATTRPGVAQP